MLDVSLVVIEFKKSIPEWEMLTSKAYTLLDDPQVLWLSELWDKGTASLLDAFANNGVELLI